MFGFNGDRKGFESILHKIASNDEQQNLTHKDVRAYARCLLKVLSEVEVFGKLQPEAEIMLVAMSCSGLPHYDRSFLAKQILKLLEDKPKSKECINDNF